MFKPLRPKQKHMCQGTGSSLVQVMHCHLVGAKPLPEPMWTYCELDPLAKLQGNFNRNSTFFHWRKCFSKCMQNGAIFLGHIALTLLVLKPAILRENRANTRAADDLVPSIVRSAAATVLILQEDWIIVIHENFNNLNHLSLEKWHKNAIIFSSFLI